MNVQGAVSIARKASPSLVLGLCLLLAPVLVVAQQQPQQQQRQEPAPPAQPAPVATPKNASGIAGIYDVRAFGAVGDGKTIDSPAINKAIETAAANGGGTVRFPAGTYLS